MRVVEVPKVLSEYVLPEALQIGVGRPLDKTRAGRMTLLSLCPGYTASRRRLQRASWKASMSRHALPYALLCSLPRQRFARCLFQRV